MISRYLPVALFIVVLSPGLLYAQPREGTSQVQPQTTYFQQFVIADATANNDKMYEDIEIFRRILGRKIQPLYPRVSYSSVISNPITSTATAPPKLNQYGQFGASQGYLDLGNGKFAAGQAYFDYGNNGDLLILGTTNTKEEVVPSLEGVYLKGQGVVYTATLSSLQPPAKDAADSAVRVWRVATVQQDSEWDSVRRQVRNEKEKPKKTEESKPPSLTDVLLKVLADNGHHFSQLGENETLTIVLTMHDSTSSSNAAKSKASAYRTESNRATTSGVSNPRVTPSDLELLGDLHQKQGRYEEATKAFRQAVDRKGVDPKEAAGLYRRLAQCYLAIDRLAEAKAALDEAARILKNVQESEDLKAANAISETASKASAAALPVKVIIAVLKKHLDQVKAGQITFEEYRRQARVETLRFGDRK